MPAIVVTAVNTGTETLTGVAHGLLTGDRFRTRNVGGALPTGLAAATDYFAIRVDADNVKPCATSADAFANTPINLTGAGSGTTTIEYGLPYCIPTALAAPNTQIKSANDNGAWAALVALYCFLVGLAQTVLTGITLAANQHITVSGTGRYKHGTMTLLIPAEAFVPDGANAHSYAHGRTTSGVGNNTATAPAFRAAIPLPVGKRILAVRVLLRDNVTGPTTVGFTVNALTASTNSNAVLGTSATSAGTAAFQSLSVTGLTTPLVAGLFANIRVISVAGTATVTIHGAEVDYDE
jgi:hypothetical protein